MPSAKELRIGYTETGRLVLPRQPVRLSAEGAKRVRGTILVLDDVIMEVEEGFPVKLYMGGNGTMVDIGIPDPNVKDKMYRVAVDIEEDDYFLSPSTETTPKS